MRSDSSGGIAHRGLMAGAAAKALIDVPAATPLGVTLDAATTVNPVQNTTYYLTAANAPITFGPSTHIYSLFDAVVGSAAYSITNEGYLRGNNGGVQLRAGGAVHNAAGGVIFGYIADGIDIYGGAGTVTNSGEIGAESTSAIQLESGGQVTNRSGGAIGGQQWGVLVTAGAGTVANTGTITGNSAAGVAMAAGGKLANWAGAAISSQDGWGVYVGGAKGAITNNGQITGGSGSGYAGVMMTAGGNVLNEAHGVISGGCGVEVGAAGSVVNAGRITGMTSDGVNLWQGGSARNETGGVISGKRYGVFVNGGAGTLTNAGKITGTAAAIMFGGSGANKLILQTGSALVGKVVGSTAAGATNALILQGSGRAANSFQDFTSLTKQGVGAWTLDGVSTFGTATVAAGTLQVGDASHAGARLVVSGAVTNNSIIEVAAGRADFIGAVSGTGSAVIGGGILQFGGNFSENVVFTGTSGVLELAHSQSYGGTITGFSLTGGTSLDLRDIHFTSGTTKATYVDNGSHTGGVLTVAYGTHTAHIHLTGDYAGSSFNTSSDSHDGTTVVDPQQGASTAAQPAAVLPFIAAMAGFGAGAGHWTPTAESGRSALPLLAAPHAGGRSFG